MNKHAQNLRALPVVLPVDTDLAILITLARAADEIDRLQGIDTQKPKAFKQIYPSFHNHRQNHENT